MRFSSFFFWVVVVVEDLKKKKKKKKKISVACRLHYDFTSIFVFNSLPCFLLFCIFFFFSFFLFSWFIYNNSICVIKHKGEDFLLLLLFLLILILVLGCVFLFFFGWWERERIKNKYWNEVIGLHATEIFFKTKNNSSTTTVEDFYFLFLISVACRPMTSLQYLFLILSLVFFFFLVLFIEPQLRQFCNVYSTSVAYRRDFFF